MAASAIGNPALLLNSRSTFHPHGVGNAHDQVGRYLMTHAQVLIAGLFAQETEPHRGFSGANLISHDNYGKTATPGAFGSRQWLLAPSLKPGDLARLARPELYGANLETLLHRAVRTGAAMAGMAEEMPLAANRVELNAAAATDGICPPKVSHTYSHTVGALIQAMRSEGTALFEAGGATDIVVTGPSTAHIMGGTVMGRDAGTSVTDSFGRVHDQSNLWLAGPGLFPTSGAVNPTFTAQALALRTAEHLLSHWAQFSG
jgi:choline dehydrogenase-like flavoprotein